MKCSEFDLGWYDQWESEHPFLEEWSRPGLTNFCGSVQAGNDVSSIRHPVFPPVSGSEESTAYLTVDGVFLPATRLQTAVAWTPWTIRRRVRTCGLEIETRTFMPWETCGIGMHLQFRAMEPGSHRIALRLSGRCLNRGLDPWFWGIPKVGLTVSDLHDQGGMNPRVEPLGTAGFLWRENPDTSPHPEAGKAFCAQVCDPAADRCLTNGDLEWSVDLDAGEVFSICFLMSMGEERKEVLAEVADVKEVPRLLAETEANWRDLWRQAFAGGPRFGGRLADPDLPEALVPVAASSILCGLMLRRQHKPLGGAVRYTISMPRRVEACMYPNDWALAGGLLARLDPEVTWEQLKMAIGSDIRRYNQVNLLTGKGGDFQEGGGWPYTMDVFNCFRVAWELVEEKGLSWLDRRMQTPEGEQSLLEVMEDLAFDWRRRRVDALGLADYGPRQELLECVSTYEHVVASLNAGAAWMLFRLADLYRGRGRNGEAEDVLREGETLVSRILEHLYVEGSGWFRVLDSEGEARECRHCWDTGMVLWCLGGRLPKQVEADMVAFFQRELQTPTWIRSLSPHDADAAVSGIRADHQFVGAYGAWPAQVALGLLRAGYRDLALEWLEGVARTARLGPFGQAHADEGVMDTVCGGAPKITDELPQCCHWCNLSGGLFYEVMLELAGR